MSGWGSGIKRGAREGRERDESEDKTGVGFAGWQSGQWQSVFRGASWASGPVGGSSSSGSGSRLEQRGQ